jgi:ribosomal protein S18 acetylase RimI-like enzyme
MELRAATPEDAPAVRAVADESWHAAHDDILGADTVDELLDDWYDVDGLAASIERADVHMFLAVVDGEVVGFSQGRPADDGPADAVVTRIYLRPAYWGEGYGTALLERLFDALRADGHESVWLAVLADNEVARSFYDAHGFAVHEERTVVLAGRETDDVVMVMEL